MDHFPGFAQGFQYFPLDDVNIDCWVAVSGECPFCGMFFCITRRVLDDSPSNIGGLTGFCGAALFLGILSMFVWVCLTIGDPQNWWVSFWCLFKANQKRVQSNGQTHMCTHVQTWLCTVCVCPVCFLDLSLCLYASRKWGRT